MDVHSDDRTVYSIHRFFGAREIPYGLALMRILLPLLLLCVVLPRWSHTRELFSTDGAAAPLALNYSVHGFPPTPSGTVAVAMMSALVFCLIASSIGWHTRLALLASWFLYTWLSMLDCLSTMTKYSVIASHVLLLLSVSRCGAIWSVDHWRTRNRTGTSDGRFPVWPRRLVQLLIGIIYLGAAFTKMHTDGFMSGDQIRYWLLTDANNTNPLGEQLALFPELIVTMSHIAVIWQILFLFLWCGRTRVVMLGAGALFHLSTIWLLGLFIFPPLMILTYLAWVNEDDVQWFRGLLSRAAASPFTNALSRVSGVLQGAASSAAPLMKAVPVPSALVFAIVLSAVVTGGIEAEHRLDPYGKRRAIGPYELSAMPADRVARLLHDSTQIRQADKFFSLELGTETLGGVVVHRGSRFQPGDRVIAQCTLVPPHEDMWVECAMADADEHELQRFGQPALRETRRINFEFQIPDYVKSGEYQFSIRCRNRTMLSRTVNIGTSADGILTN